MIFTCLAVLFMVICSSYASDASITNIDKAILTTYVRHCVAKKGDVSGLVNDRFAIILAERNTLDPRMILLNTTIYDAKALCGSRLTEHLLDIERCSTFYGNVLGCIAELCPGALPEQYARISNYTKYKHQDGLFISLQSVFPRSVLQSVLDDIVGDSQKTDDDERNTNKIFYPWAEESR